MENFVFQTKKIIKLQGKLLDLSRPVVMGILNVTPDSFYDGGKYNDIDKIIVQAKQMVQQGATFIDIGGYSTRPNAEEVSEKEELQRIIPAILAIKEKMPSVFISIDTFRAKVATQAVEAGAVLVNDVSGGSLDSQMFETVAKLGVPYVLMHMKGTPKTMSEHSDYKDIFSEITDYFTQKIAELTKLGVHDVILDVGFGFAKNMAQNYVLLNKLAYFKSLGLPLMAGISRKSMIYKRLDINADESLNGTTVLNTVALKNGASILRVHDVKEAMEVINLLY
ncbi:MAG: dihydropteroate synthase [Bacteroidetes bacterium]|nr:MAG: dihydropteroate synthase [Bacteroidota bacterium]